MVDLPNLRPAQKPAASCPVPIITARVLRLVRLLVFLQIMTAFVSIGFFVAVVATAATR